VAVAREDKVRRYTHAAGGRAQTATRPLDHTKVHADDAGDLDAAIAAIAAFAVLDGRLVAVQAELRLQRRREEMRPSDVHVKLVEALAASCGMHFSAAVAAVAAAQGKRVVRPPPRASTPPPPHPPSAARFRPPALSCPVPPGPSPGQSLHTPAGHPPRISVPPPIAAPVRQGVRMAVYICIENLNLHPAVSVLLIFASPPARLQSKSNRCI
jgi:hypothetical protein